MEYIYFRNFNMGSHGILKIQIDTHLYPDIAALNKLCIEFPEEYYKIKK